MIASASTDARRLSARRSEELYLTFSPEANRATSHQARQLYGSIREALAAASARILSERIFATAEGMAAIEPVRTEMLGDLDDGVGPTRVLVESGRLGQIAGVQVHAVSGAAPIGIGGSGRRVSGRELRIGNDRWLLLCGLTGDARATSREQARQMFEGAGQLLRDARTSMRSVARTWLWLRNVCDWYDDLNAVRTDFFRREGLIGNGNGRRPRLPASTGIGLGVLSGAACALDLIAIPGAEDRIEFLEAGGHQNSAFAYGSAFSRAAIAPMPAGRTLLVSGTAAIDASGRTEHVGRIDAQIEATIRHVRALLTAAGCRDENVLTALVYCKTRQVEDAFCAARSNWASLNWPAVSMIADICRPDLLFEVELVAGPVPQSRRLAQSARRERTVAP